MKLTVVLGVLVGTLVLACSSAAPAPVEPTPNIGATVDAALARVPTVTPIPTPTPPTTLTSTSTTTPAPTSVFITIYEALAEFGFQVGVQKIADSYSYPLYEVMEDMRQGFPVEFRESIQQLVTGAGFPQGHVTCDMYGNSLDSFSREKLEQVSFSFGFEDTPTAISITPDEVRATPCYTVVPAATSVPTPTEIPIFAPKAMLTPISALTHTHLPV